MTKENEKSIIAKFHPEAVGFVTSIIKEVYEKEWGVGKDQLATSLLKLSDGSLDKLLSYFPIVDPRDIIEAAM